MMRGGWTKVGLAGAAIAVLAAGIGVYSSSDRDQTAEPAAPQPVPVIATTVQQHDVPIILTGLGTVTALNTATVHSQITGLLVIAARDIRASLGPVKINWRLIVGRKAQTWSVRDPKCQREGEFAVRER
jgi:hypothetical protein